MSVSLITVEQAAQALGCEPPTVEQALRDGDLPGVRQFSSAVSAASTPTKPQPPPQA